MLIQLITACGAAHPKLIAVPPEVNTWRVPIRSPRRFLGQPSEAVCTEVEFKIREFRWEGEMLHHVRLFREVVE